MEITKTRFEHEVTAPNIDALAEKLDRIHEELTNDLEAAMLSIAALTTKVVNLANKLEEHLKERDAHNPGVMRGK